MQAQAADDHLYVAPSVNCTFPDNDRRADDGYGEAKPAYSNATREGQAKNRRVELVVK